VNKEQWQQIEKIFYAAMELPHGEREAFVSQACAGDEDLRREVQALLAANQNAESFLDSPVNMPPHSGTFSPTLVMPHPAANAGAAAESGFRIGVYRLIREIGRGGMGAVWLAERADGQFYQQVAIKLLHAGSENEEVIRRFRHERQILASLDHPNIARLLDGGTTEDGRPYFVMEYIEGLPIDEYCRQHQVSVDDRLKLFRQVCAAVHYAHQNLVIHRDLKPSNIAVTADGTPKLLDFGIAKLIQPDLSRSYDTLSGVTPMTPAYASPEQVRGEKLTTASDVYSLGVVLYELLTGRSPYRLKANIFGELMRAVIEQEPERPSTAITRSDGTPKTNPITVEPTEKLRRRLSGDIDSIVLMALRKEPPSQYGSVEQFSEDVRRYLEGLPTVARRGTFGYRALKYIRRNKVPVAAAALIVLSLLGGIGATMRQAQIAKAAQFQAETEKSEAQSQRNRAEAALTIAEERRQQAEAARTEANQQRDEAETERNVAQTQRQRAETQELSNRQLLYTSRIGLAQQAWENSNIERMRELLDFYLPQANEPDFRGFEWYYLWRLCHREEKNITGGDFRGVAYGPDNKSLLTLAITRDNTAEVAFRDVTSWQVLASHRYNASIGAVAVSRNTDKVVVGLQPEGIRVFSFSDYKEHLQIRGLKDVASVAISPSGKMIAAGFSNGKIQLFDVETGKEICALVGHQQYLTTLAFSSDEQTLASGCFDGTLRLWDVRTGKEIKSLKQNRSVPNSVTFTHDDKAVIAVCNTELKVWETATGKEIASRSIGLGRPVLALSPDGKTLATVDVQPVIHLWETQTWQEKAAIKGHGNVVRSLAYSPDGTHLASGSLDQTARVWNLSRNVQDVIQLTNPENSANFSRALFTPDGQRIISAQLMAGLVSIWDRISGRKLFDLRGHTKPATISNFSLELAVSSDSRFIATGGADSLVKIWEAETGCAIRTLSDLPSPSTALAFAPGNHLLAIGTEQAVRIYDLAQGCEKITMPIVQGVRALCFLADGKTLATTGRDGMIRFWEIATGQEQRKIQTGQDRLFTLTLSADGKYLATGSQDNTAAIWEVQTGNRVWLLKGHSSQINNKVSFSPDGKRLATSSNDFTVKLWDLTTGQEMLTFKEGGGCSVHFSPDGRQLLSACRNNLTIWPAATEREVLTRSKAGNHPLRAN